MNAWETLLLLVTLVLCFLTLHYFGLMVVKCGSYWGNALATPAKFWGEYRHLSGYVSKNFRVSAKYCTLAVQVEPVSGSADVEVLDTNGNILYTWKAVCPLEREIDCRDLKRCKVRLSSQNFAGKFLISLQ